MLHVCCFVGQHPISCYITALCSHPLSVHDGIRDFCFSVASTAVMFDWAPPWYCGPLLVGSWPKVALRGGSAPFILFLLLLLLGTRVQHRGQLSASSRKLPPAAGRSHTSRKARSRLHSEHMRDCSFGGVSLLLYLTPKRRMWQNRRAFWESGNRGWNKMISRYKPVSAGGCATWSLTLIDTSTLNRRLHWSISILCSLHAVFAFST